MTLSDIEIIYNCQPTPSLILDSNSADFKIATVNKAFLETLHLEKQDIVGRGYFEAFPMNPDDNGSRTKNVHDAFEYVKRYKKAHQIKKHQYDLPSAESDQLDTYYWKIDTYPILDINGEVLYIVQSSTDITSFYYEVQEKLKARLAARLSYDLERLEKNVLQLNSQKNVSINEVLFFYVTEIEVLFPDMQCSILQVRNNQLHNWASPSLDKAYIQAIEGLVIGNNVGSCGTAAFTKEQVIVNDIAHDPAWFDYSHIALKFGLKACWSQPIVSSDGEVLATFAIYYKKIKKPDLPELNIIDRATSLLKVILENKHYARVLKDNSLLMIQGQELAHFGNWSWDIMDDVVSWSDALYEICGLNKSEVKLNYKSFEDILHPDDKERVTTAIEQLFRTKENTEFEERIIRPDGEVRYLKSWKSIKCDESGKPVTLFGASLDITASKKTQEELLTSESRLRSLVDAQTNYVIRLDLNGKYTYYNNKYKDDFSWIYGSGDFLGCDSMLSVHLDHHPRVKEVAKNCLDQPNRVFQLEINKPTRDGVAKSTLWHLIALTDSNNIATEFQCIGIDITELKQTEKALQLSNELYAYVNMATNDAIYDCDLIQNHTQWGDAFYRVFGHEYTQDIYPVEKWAAFVHKDDVDRVKKSFFDTLEDQSQTNWKSEYRFQRGDGGFAYTEENGYIIRDSTGKALRMIGVLRDVTENKKAKSELEAAKDRYRDIFYLSPQPMIVYELGPLAILDVNSAFIAHYGYSREELLSMTLRDLRTPEEIKKLNDLFLYEVKPGLSHTNLSRHRKKSGELIDVLTKGNSITYKGKEARIVIAVDITDKMKAEQALRVSERRFKNLIQNGSDLISILDSEGNYLYVSPNIQRVMSFEYNLTGKNAFDFIYEEDKALVLKEMEMLKDKKRVELSPFRFTYGNNGVRWLQTIVTDMREDQAIQGIVANARDITQRMQQELKIKEHLERFDIVSKATSDTIWDANLLTGEVRWNHGIHNIFGHIETSGDKWWEEHVHPQDLQRVTDTVTHTKEQRTSRWTNEYRFRCADGTYKFVLDRGFLTFDDEGHAVRMIGAMQDITERVNYITTIEQKNLRLKEIAWTQAHLVRAPLARIMGIMNLINDPKRSEDVEELFIYLNVSVNELDKIIRDVIDKSYT